jgi:hypothetical protein
MKTISLLLLTIGLGINCQAQISLGGLKNKVKSKAATTIKKDSNSGSTTANAKGPASEEISKYNNRMSFARNSVNDMVRGACSHCVTDLEKVELSLKAIKEKDPKWKGYGEAEAAYLALKKQYDDGFAEGQFLQQVDKVKNSISIAKNSVKGNRNGDCTYCDSDIEKARKKIAEAKETNPEWAEFDSYTKEIDELDKFWKTEELSGKFYWEVFKFKSDINQFVEHKPWAFDQIDNVLKTDYEALKTKVTSAGLNEEQMSSISFMLKSTDEFYASGYEPIKLEAVKELDKVIGKTDYYSTANRTTPEFYENILGHSGLEVPIQNLKDLQVLCKRFQTMIPNEPTINSYYPKIAERLADLEAYHATGQHQILIEKRRVEMMDKIRVERGGRSDAAMTSIVKRDVSSAFMTSSSILRVSTHGSWQVKKNALDYPKYKSIVVQIVFKDPKDGNCYLWYSWIHKEHLGGGSYGKAFFTNNGAWEEMLCKNAYK